MENENANALYLMEFKANKLLSNEYFYTLPPKPVLVYPNYQLTPPKEKQYVLRMLIKTPLLDEFKIPEELNWLRDYINTCHEFQTDNFGEYFAEDRYVYLTVRHGLLESKTDDEWHVDGYSMSQPHLPEQNYLYSSNNPTEYIDSIIPIPKDFYGKVYNLTTYFNDYINSNNDLPIKQLKEQSIYVIDPYVVHRRPLGIEGKQRTFVRLSYVTIPIKSGDNMTPNPLLTDYSFKPRKDFRKGLYRYVQSS